MTNKPYIRWEFDFSMPSEMTHSGLTDFQNWLFYKRVGSGVTVLRLLGVTVRVFK